MDLTKPVFYRNLAINTVITQAGSRVLQGVSIEDIDYSLINAVGYQEKRAAADGVHASDVYLGARMINLSGLIYAASREDLFDRLHLIRSVFSPTSAYAEDPGDRGFIPLYFKQATADHTSWPGGTSPPPFTITDEAGTMNLLMNCRPMNGSPRFSISRDRLLASDTPDRPTATPWTVQLWAKDPRVYVNPEQSAALNGLSLNTQYNWTAQNRGDYETPMNILLSIGGTAPGGTKTFHLWGLNNIDMTITIENVANRNYRWFGDDRVLMVQDASAGLSAPYVLRMDLVKFTTANQRPMVPAAINPPSRPFSTPYSWQTSAVLAAGSRLWWNEAFA